jgi:hypothetical protein
MPDTAGPAVPEALEPPDNSRHARKRAGLAFTAIRAALRELVETRWLTLAEAESAFRAMAQHMDAKQAGEVVAVEAPKLVSASSSVRAAIEDARHERLS